MITLNFDLSTGLAKLAQTTTIVLGAHVPVQVVFSAAPGNVSAIQLALGEDASSPTVRAYTDTFTQDNDMTWSAVLDASDSRLVTFMGSKNVTSINLELAVEIDGVTRVAPHLSITIQPNIISGPTTTEGGPSFYTTTVVDGKLATYTPLTVALKYRFKPDGTFQLWNNTQSKWHTLTVTGAVGAEVMQIGAGEA